MAKTLSSASITDGSTVEAWHVTQSIDAFNGVEAYDITISGSLTLSGDTVLTGTASYASTSNFATSAGTASLATTATLATSASHAVTASYSENAGGSDTGSLLTTASVSDATITFTKGDASTFNVVVNNVTTANTASYVAGGAVDGTVTTASNLKAGGNLAGLTTASGHIIPNGNDLYDLGTAEKKFRDLYLGSNSIYMSGSGGWMTGSWDGTNFKVNNNALVKSAVTGSMTVRNSERVVGNFNVTADPNSPATGPLTFAAGGATLASGTVLISAFGAELAGLVLGDNCWITVTAVNGITSTGVFDVALAGNGRITITEIGGTSNANIMYQIIYYLP